MNAIVALPTVFGLIVATSAVNVVELAIALVFAIGQVAFWLTLMVAGSLSAIPTFIYEYSSPLSYLFTGSILYYLMAPHPTAFSAPRLNRVALKNLNWKTVDWKAKVSELKTGKRYAVIGAGFVGKKLIHTLLLRGETQIVAFDMDPKACDVFKGDQRVTFIRGDVTKYEQVLQAVQGADVVYATFAIIRYMDRLEKQAALSYNINVVGTENVVRACQAAHVKILVQTSTSNVCINAEQSTLDMDEKVDYVTRETSPNHYGWTKAIAEQIVLKADGFAGLRTAAVRPCSGVFGAEDRHLLDGFLKLGRTPLPPNGGSTVIDFVSVMNVVWGHLLAEHAMWTRPEEGIAGEAFCVSNNAPMRMIDFCGLVNHVRPGGLVTIPTPHRLLHGLAYAVEGATALGFKVPGVLGQLTAATVEYLELSYAFSSRKAHERLGYEPLFTVEQAVQMSVDEWLQGKMLPELPSA